MNGASHVGRADETRKAYSIVKKRLVLLIRCLAWNLTTMHRDSSGFSHGSQRSHSSCSRQLTIVLIARCLRSDHHSKHHPNLLLARQPLRDPWVDGPDIPHPKLRHGFPALLFQSILLIISQLFLLSLCLHYAPLDSSYTVSTPLPTLSPLPDAEDEPGHREDYLDRPMGPSKKLGQGVRRPFEFWQWEGYGSYLEFLAGMIIVLGMLQLVFGRWMW